MRLKKVLNPLRWFGRYGVLSDIKWWILYRTIEKYNVIHIKSLKPGYYDTDTQMLHAVFQLLVDYVEKELAYREYWLDENKEVVSTWSKWKRFKVWFIANVPLIRKLVDFRFRDLGLNAVKFYQEYEDDQFPETVQSWRDYGNEIHDLYIWWKDKRPNRPCSMDVSGWSELCDKYPLKFEKDPDSDLYRTVRYSDEVEKLMSQVAAKTHEIDEQYDQEDEDMMIRLIKIRRGLWT